MSAAPPAVGLGVVPLVGVTGGVPVLVDPHAFSGELAVRAEGDPAAKSDALLSASVQPEAALNSAVVFVRVGAGEPSEQFASPYPTKSIAPVVGQVPVKRAVVLTSAIFPVVALKLTLPVAWD